MKPGDLVRTTFGVQLYSTIFEFSIHTPCFPLGKGTVGIVIESSEGGWIRWITSDGKVGYVSRDFLEVVG